jgi:hypothetical protein
VIVVIGTQVRIDRAANSAPYEFAGFCRLSGTSSVLVFRVCGGAHMSGVL